MPSLAMEGHRPADASIPPKDGHCAFFKLPAEIRNLVYQFALTEEHEIGYGDIRNLECNFDLKVQPLIILTVDREMPFNQLKYVSRQLYAETAGFGLKRNTLSFRGSGCYSMIRFKHFVNNCSTYQQGQIRKVVVSIGLDGMVDFWRSIEIGKCYPDAQNAFEEIYEFCHSHPKVAVVLAQENFGNHPFFFLVGIFVLLTGSYPPCMTDIEQWLVEYDWDIVLSKMGHILGMVGFETRGIDMTRRLPSLRINPLSICTSLKSTTAPPHLDKIAGAGYKFSDREKEERQKTINEIW
jgi:hypothetical protein